MKHAVVEYVYVPLMSFCPFLSPFSSFSPPPPHHTIVLSSTPYHCPLLLLHAIPFSCSSSTPHHPLLLLTILFYSPATPLSRHSPPHFFPLQGFVHHVVEQKTCLMPNYSNNTKKSWVAVDLGKGRRLMPTRYCIRYSTVQYTFGCSFDTHVLNFYYRPLLFLPLFTMVHTMSTRLSSHLTSSPLLSPFHPSSSSVPFPQTRCFWPWQRS
jgi:hypothetical protein